MSCIDKGTSLVATTQKQIAEYVTVIREVAQLLDPTTNRWHTRERQFGKLESKLLSDADPIYQKMGRVMSSFKPGLFVGGSRSDLPHDNLDLERWFRLPKSHERRIHGRCHAGVRIVQEGESMMLALDAHRHHPEAFTEPELRAYRNAQMSDLHKEVMHRRKVMRAARSTIKRTRLLRNLELRYAALPHQ